jgi:hypothetical protein
MKLLAIAPLLVVPLTFVAVLLSATPRVPFPRVELPDEALERDHCTWSCHNYGCHHASKLPDALTSDASLFGWTVRALHRMGDALSPKDTFVGYGAVNLAVFCVGWPGAMYALWGFALRTRAARLALRRGRA